MAIIYSKPLNKSDIEVQLVVPNDSLGAIAVPAGEHCEDFEAIDANGRVWPFRISTRTKGTSFKTVISDSGPGEGWLKFIQNEDLRKGDKLIFHGETNEAKELRFRIQLERN